MELQLDQLKKQQKALIKNLGGSKIENQRLMEMGFVPGCSVLRGEEAPLGDPRVFYLDQLKVFMRLNLAEKVTVELVND